MREKVEDSFWWQRRAAGRAVYIDRGFANSVVEKKTKFLAFKIDQSESKVNDRKKREKVTIKLMLKITESEERRQKPTRQRNVKRSAQLRRDFFAAR